jgi:putative tryptophan/tyrosine transport system substrate-binding protein
MGADVRRRRFLTCCAAGLMAPIAAMAQPPGKVYRIGFLGGASLAGYASLVDAFRLGLRDYGYVEGKNITIEYRWAEGKYERLRALAAELVRLQPDVIVTQGTPAVLAAKQATATIPIVMAIAGDPVHSGVVSSLARPGRNVTGSSFFMGELNAKRLELIKTVIPGLQRAGALMNPDNAMMGSVLRAMEERASALTVKVQPVYVRDLDELDAALAVAKKQVEALTVTDEGLFITNARRIAELVTKHRLPSIGFREYCESGGLLAYAVDFPHIWRQSAALVDRVLKGAKAGDLPIQQATRFELIINLRTASAIGLSIPTAIRLRADHIIE